MKFRIFVILLFCSHFLLSAQVINPVRWQWALENVTATEAEIRFTAMIEPGWSMYAIDLPDVFPRPIPTSFVFEPNTAFELAGEMEQVIRPEVSSDPFFGNAQIGKFKNLAVFRQKIRILRSEDFTVKAEVEFMCCDDNTCTAPQIVEFEIRISPPRTAATTATPATQNTESAPVLETVEGNMFMQASPENENVHEHVHEHSELTSLTPETQTPLTSSDASLWTFLLVAILAGFGSVLTPCVYPMIPMTVSFFMRDTSNRTTGVVKALIFGFSIMLIYTLIGVIVALTKRADLVNTLVSHWLTNLVFAGIFIAFALSFFGLFEITLSGAFADKIDRKADKGGYLSAFFMALALVIISFSCTGPFVGSILVVSTQGLAIKPILGMFGFGLAFALPFTFLACFPSLMKKLPKSGGWMNSIKVVFAFLLLVFTLYFLSIADKGLGLNIISRDVFLCIWIVLFALAGFYMLGKIRFSHDEEIHHISVTRLFFASASFVFALYLFTGLLGARLNAVAGLLPADTGYRMTDATSQYVVTQLPDHLCGVPKYSDNTRLGYPYGLSGYFDYDEALICAREKNKPVLLIFKGHACPKCREMEALVWSDPEILRLMNEQFILLALYTDDTTPLPENEWITSTQDGRIKRTMGQRNADFQITRYDTNAFPYHAILNANGETVGETIAFTSSIEVFANWLKTGLQVANLSL